MFYTKLESQKKKQQQQRNKKKEESITCILTGHVSFQNTLATKLEVIFKWFRFILNKPVGTARILFPSKDNSLNDLGEEK